jgi:uncharacterized protein YjiS (DUF1127 family)
MACGNHAIVNLPIRDAAGPASPRFDVGSALHRSRALLRTWLARRRQRRALSDLDDHLLRDLGLTRAAAAREEAKPFWRP